MVDHHYLTTGEFDTLPELVQAEINTLNSEIMRLKALLAECSDAFGIRDDFVPLGPAIDLAPKIRKALA